MLKGRKSPSGRVSAVRLVSYSVRKKELCDMSKELKFYLCKHCGNLVDTINIGGGTLVCCGDNMTELVPNTTEAATEKHLPVVKTEGGKVSVHVGSVDHPMAAEHYIEWIVLETRKGVLRRHLNPGEAPQADFVLADDEPVAAYAYCNLHGLWKTSL